MDLPPTLRTSLASFPSDVASTWLEALPDRLAAASERWGIRIGAPYDPGGVTSYVAPAETASGDRLVYKITVPHDEAVGEAEALRAYDGDGAVRVVASRADTYELLIERADPGNDLWTVGDDRSRLEIACEVAGRLRRPVEREAIASLEAVTTAWADVAERRLITSELPWIPDPIERGVDLLRALPVEADSSMLVHGDFHPGNLLAAQREPWLAIDPKPLVGDPAFEPIQLLTQRAGRIAEPPPTADVEERLTTIADLLDLDATRIARWGIARCSEWSMWSWDHGDTIDAAIAYTWARALDDLA